MLISEKQYRKVMSKANPLAGLIGNYEDSDEEDALDPPKASENAATPPLPPPEVPGGILPPPIPHCAWSACYDETSGFTYYWNQNTNEVTWEAPAEYLLALKLAKQNINASGSVSAAEWQLYQQALAKKQAPQKASPPKKPVHKNDQKPPSKDKNGKPVKKNKRSFSDDEDVKIELITSYHNSDSESNDEAESPAKAKPPPVLPTPVTQTVRPKIALKKQKVKHNVEFGPSLPLNQNYSVPIGPELPPSMAVEKSPEVKPQTVKKEEKKSSKTNSDNEDSQDENLLLKKLKDKAKLLEKLGGEIPTELQKFIEDETTSKSSSPRIIDETSRDSKTIDMNIDDLLEEIEKKELPKVKTRNLNMFDEDSNNSQSNAGSFPNSPKEVKSLFPSSKTIMEEPEIPVQNGSVETTNKTIPAVTEKKDINLYMSNTSEVVSKKKLRISNSVLPERKKPETPVYTTRYSQHIEGFSSERTGLGFSNNDEELAPKNAISYGNGLLFTKGETLNEERREEDLDDMADLVEAKLKYLCGVQPCVITPVNEMLIQMQTLVSAFRAGALSSAYWRRWSATAAATLRRHEANAAPPGWTAQFLRSEGRYRYCRESDGFTQYEFPATDACDMEICTTPPPPPPPPAESKLPPPPAPATPPAPPPPPQWDPPPPGCDPTPIIQPKQDDELLSFYNDIAELEKTTVKSASISPEPLPPPPPPPPEISRESERAESREREREDRRDKIKKKSKMKISSSIGMKQKTVTSMVAKWQKVSEEINSD